MTSYPMILLIMSFVCYLLSNPIAFTAEVRLTNSTVTMCAWRVFVNSFPCALVCKMSVTCVCDYNLCPCYLTSLISEWVALVWAAPSRLACISLLWVKNSSTPINGKLMVLSCYFCFLCCFCSFCLLFLLFPSKLLLPVKTCFQVFELFAWVHPLPVLTVSPFKAAQPSKDKVWDHQHRQLDSQA